MTGERYEVRERKLYVLWDNDRDDSVTSSADEDQIQEQLDFHRKLEADLQEEQKRDSE